MAPVRDALTKTSTLLASVRKGIEAVDGSDHKHLADVGRAFGDSLCLDAALRLQHAEENRWDYLLGHTASGAVVGVEAHSARTDQINAVIQKKKAATQQLRGHLKPGKRVSIWLWVASGRVDFADTEKARRRLDQSGIRFVGTRVQSKHLPDRNT